MRREAEENAASEHRGLEEIRRARAETEQQLQDTLSQLGEERLRRQLAESQLKNRAPILERLADMARR
jgi:hypothetical protein